MATITPTVTEDVSTQTVIVEWANMTVGDDGAPFECKGLVVRAHHGFGNFAGGAVISFQGSLEATPVNYGELLPIGNLLTGAARSYILSAMKPVITSGNGSTDVSLVVVLRPASEFNGGFN
jgi:hypothetical protein